MYIIRGDVGTSGSEVTYDFPADSCFWTTTPTSTGGYEIGQAFLLTQFAAVAINGTTSTATGHITIANAKLGYIGKSGRFVAITN